MTTPRERRDRAGTVLHRLLVVAAAALLLVLLPTATTIQQAAASEVDMEMAGSVDFGVDLDASPSPVHCTSASDCHGNGVCKAGVCMCVQPFTGPACERITCPNQCSGTGRCDLSTGVCFCYNATQLAAIYPTDGPEHEWGFEGPDCSLKACFSDCGERQGRGRCNKQTGLCECKKGFWGPEGLHCNSVLCDDTCSAHGFCVDGGCICDVAANKLSGWYGEKCEKPVCPNHCMESAGLGKCINARCVCAAGWWGEDCSQKSCPANYSPLAWKGAQKVMCSGHGQCNNGVCSCMEGFTGADCSVRQCPGLTLHGAETNVSCSGHGTCQPNGVCVCDAGYKGEECFDRACTSDCGLSKKRGECDTEIGHCACAEGWYGADCTFKKCSDSCNGNGQCLDDACVCNPGFQGFHCETPVCGNNCSFADGQGQCINNQCVCNPGFNGVECLYKDCPKAANPSTTTGDLLTCAGNGVCTAGQCVCNPAWAGADCTARACPFNCSNVGTCNTDGTCTCPAGDATGHGGFLGKFCEKELCPSGCGAKQGQGKCVNGACQCEAGFGAPDCLYSACPVGLPLLSAITTTPIICSGMGSCVKGQCVCQPGWTGPNCASKPCPNDCGSKDGHGQCQPNGVCKCDDHFTGLDCSTRSCPLGCSGHGSCAGEDGTCRCDPRWTGERCEILRCPNGCSGAGECVRTPAVNETTPATEVCKCDPGYSGPDCSQPVCLPLGKDGAMCNGKGRCQVSEDGTHTCRCDPPYAGLECGNTVCNSTCSYHGVCTGSATDATRCVCDDGWFGPNCDRTGECDPYDCFARGTCVAGLNNLPTCKCNLPFGGPDCSLCVHNCTGHGQCTPNGCVCEDGWLGPLCDRREDCDPADCGGADHGRCVADANGLPVCQCKFPWTDFDCLECTLRCSDHGECNSKGTCTCDPGWSGPNCERYGDCPNHCSERGRCMGNEHGDPVCKCDEGYAGRDCGQIVCNKKCGKNQVCRDDQCECAEGWTGDQCDQRDDCPHDCHGLGQCMADVKGKPFCKCKIGRGGASCEFEVCNLACSDHGTCFVHKGKQQCKCDPGFGGPDCSIIDCGIWNDCGGSTHGECTKDARGKPQCLCVPPYTGPSCGDILCSTNDCVHGTCKNDKCICADGWRGPKCDYRVPCPAPGCGPDGKCIGDGKGKGKCECNPGFTGPNCADVVCDNKCSGHGTCVNNGCECHSGFHGQDCSITAPCPDNCNGHGECNYDVAKKTSVCDCEDLWDSAPGKGDCSVQRGKTWMDAGGKLQYKCSAPYYGNLCQSKGCAKDCKNGGTCAPDGECDCPVGFSGSDCSQTVCPDGCNGGGECDLAAKVCRCFYGYSGPSCATYSESACLSTCSFKCSTYGAAGLIQISDRDGLTRWVSARECQELCKLPTMCDVMFGSGHVNNPKRTYVTMEKRAQKSKAQKVKKRT
jgi:hypothetical protein